MNRLQIVHTTGYRYSEGAATSFNEVRMTPRTTREQFARFWRVEVSPQAWTHTYTDYWGTQVTAFEVDERHERLKVVATSTVEVDRSAVHGKELSWADLAAPQLTDYMVESLVIGTHVEPGSELKTIARSLARSAEKPSDMVLPLITAIREHVDYMKGVTKVQTRAFEAWDAGAGVCQDMVHLTVGALRSVGIPAQYVSGYVMPSANPIIGEPVIGESHSWVHWWDGTWMAYDPANDVVPGDYHVEVGVGRDYSDVPPLKGIYAGGGESDMYVQVEMTQLS